MSIQDSSNKPVDSDDCIKSFFPATSDNFVAKCGAVAAVKASDFEDVYRKRHLESFQKSWNEWASYDPMERHSTKMEKVLEFVSHLVLAAPRTQKEFSDVERSLRKELKISLSKSQMLAIYDQISAGDRKIENPLSQFLVKKAVRTHSGVVVITVLTSPGAFSCPKDCYYCPNEPGQPRSYLSTEPAVLRANQNGWDAALQFWDRASTLYHNGHTIDKIEVLVLGGTWSGYPKSYQEEFVRDLFYAANTFTDYLESYEEKCRHQATSTATSQLSSRTLGDLRSRLSLEEEQCINEHACSRIIGLTLETRPDHISKGELKRLRRLGCTRVQIGIQHTNGKILEKVNRGCTLGDAIRAMRLLKDSCFKVDIHLMPDLPGSSPGLDKDMFEYILSTPDLQADQWKIYPCEVTPFSQIEKWYKDGHYMPYAERFNGQELTQLLVKVKTAVHPWIRLNRIVRDIPNPSIIAGNDKTNLRQLLLSCMSRRGLVCRCLRCREVKTDILDTSIGCLKIRQYETYGGDEYFISYETADEKKLFGFLRLRLRHCGSKEAQPAKREKNDFNFKLDQSFPELIGSGLIRELHVYGQLVGSQEQKSETDSRPQHTGFGKRLLAAAEVISIANGLDKIAVIAGIGTRNYYRKFDYQVEGHYMTKKISLESVSRLLKQLEMCLPLTVQLYTLKTDLGCLDVGVDPDATNNVQVEVNVRENRNLAIDREKQYKGKKAKKSRVKPDILALFGDNCSSEIRSCVWSTARVFLDRVEAEQISQPRYSFCNMLLKTTCRRLENPLVQAISAVSLIITTVLLWNKWKKKH